MEEIIKKRSFAEVKALMELMKLSATKGEGSGLSHSQTMKLDLPPVDLKLDGPATYLSWSRRIEAALIGKRLHGYLIGAKAEPVGDNVEEDEWKTIHALLYTWLLNSMVPKVASAVDGIRKVQDIWTKLKRIYAGAENHIRVFQIQREIEAGMQGDRSIQEYSMELEQLWQDLDRFSPMSSCNDPGCKSRKFTYTLMWFGTQMW
jgi:gag-polypeptide of LTR copia-type